MNGYNFGSTLSDYHQVIRIGIISDTHGLLRPEAVAFLRGCYHIVHSGDIGHADIIPQLSALAPITAVRGNTDRRAWAAEFPETALVKIGKIAIYVLHDLEQLSIHPKAADIHVVVSGHTHQPLIKQQDGVLYINPGSAGPVRENLPISMAQLVVSDQSISAQIIDITDKNTI